MLSKTSNQDPLFKRFKEPIESDDLPGHFTFPFYYEPHPLCLKAVGSLQAHLENQTNWTHDFGVNHFVEGVNVGKMFGVLLVQNNHNEIGYLSAFSGKLADSSHQPGFVPPVADILIENGFFRKGEKEIEAITAELDGLLKSKAYQNCLSRFDQEYKLSSQELNWQKQKMKTAKKARNERRKSGNLSLIEIEELENESKRHHFEQKDLKKHWDLKLQKLQSEKEVFDLKIQSLRKARKARSSALQKELFEQYKFLNIKGETKSLNDIFDSTSQKTPPSGAGECAIPKLLQYAFLHEMKPLAMAEFWWGQSPKSEIRKHGYFYPSCKGKCEPILSHMLDGMKVDTSPISHVSTTNKKLEAVFEDEHLLLIDKPADFLSVPGRTNADSVYERMLKTYPNATGPMIVHRLDRATSGLMIITKTKEAHQNLQDQFRTRTIKKKYIAILEGNIESDKGVIDLPLRVDLEDRPRQLVCFEYGKPAQTVWKVVGRKHGRTRIEFSPITGRTHQLRVHAAHPDGLNTPIVGDDLYGKKDTRLHLHAAEITFEHPISKEKMTFEQLPDF